MKILTTRFAATLLKSLHPNSIPVTSNVYAYLHTSKRYMLPNLPLCEIEIACSGIDTGAALHWWARIELVNHIIGKPNKNAAILDFYKIHNLDFWDYDYESAARNCKRVVKNAATGSQNTVNHVLNQRAYKPLTLAQKLIKANTQIKAYLDARGCTLCPMFISVLALRYNTKYTIFQISNNLDISTRMVHKYLAKLKTLPFPIPSSVLCVE